MGGPSPGPDSTAVFACCLANEQDCISPRSAHFWAWFTLNENNFLLCVNGYVVAVGPGLMELCRVWSRGSVLAVVLSFGFLC